MTDFVDISAETCNTQMPLRSMLRLCKMKNKYCQIGTYTGTCTDFDQNGKHFDSDTHLHAHPNDPQNIFY